ncbi:MAG: hypothetical protein WAU37_05235 [Formosimonas sp.]
MNCGSSLVKFSVLSLASRELLISGLTEQLGSDAAEITFKNDTEKSVHALNVTQLLTTS